MATRSAIAMEDANGIHVIYAHWDGHIETNGRTLMQHYTCKEHVDELISLGDISSLGDAADTCEAYSRDRGEPFEQTRARTYADFQTALEQEFENSDREFFYVYLKGGTWAVIDSNTQETQGVCKLADKVAQLTRQKMHLV